jgi:cell division protein FtsQ
MMKKYQKPLKILVLTAIVVFLYGFADHRSSLRDSSEVKVSFENGENLFISYETVDKLLIQKLTPSDLTSKENINLNLLEEFLQNNQMVENAEIYLTLTGELGAIIKQRTPVLRVAGGAETYYYDTRGMRMPLSDNYSARVPITMDTVSGQGRSDLIALSNAIQSDDFLRKQIIGVDQLQEGGKFPYELNTRVGNQKIIFGDLRQMDQKIAKLKVFYKKTVRDDTYKNYKSINLKFNNQIVCER